MTSATAPVPAASTDAPYPGSHQMPRWGMGPLNTPPIFTWRNWFAMLGPGLMMAGSGIGGGEWLMGPLITAKYGGALMWMATISILGQVFYNIEVSRYTLYTGEPIFTGYFRSLPGPRFWLAVYLLLDFGALFPYLASNAATPLGAIFLGRIPTEADRGLLVALAYVIFLAGFIPLIFGGKIYNTLKAIMSFKVIVVLGWLIFLAIFFSTSYSRNEIMRGFFSIGTLPIAADSPVAIVQQATGSNEFAPTENIFTALFSRGAFPDFDWAILGTITAFAAIAGSGGLSNAPISNYTRDQGWGMGYLVGAIPSVVGGHNLTLSHVGKVFRVDRESLVKWRGWVRHVVRDQVVLWLPTCLFGVALPSILSLQFLPKGTTADNWTAAGMTADGVSHHLGEAWGYSAGMAGWYMTLICGFLVLGPTWAVAADGVVRRWVDVFWTSSKRLRELDPHNIKYVYFSVLCGLAVVGMLMLAIGEPLMLLKLASVVMNFALGFSAFHTLVVNLTLLPPDLRPSWFMRIGLSLAGAYFVLLGVLAGGQVFYSQIMPALGWR